MSAPSGQDPLNSNKDIWKLRTTEYIYLTDSSSPGNSPVSPHSKENARKIGSSSKHHSEGSASEGAPSPPPASTKPLRGWKANYIDYLPFIDADSQSSEPRGHSEVHSPRSAILESLPSPNTTRPLSLVPKPSGPHAARMRKENSRSSVSSETRRPSHSTTSHPPKPFNPLDSPKWEVERASRDVTNERTAAGAPNTANWDAMQREVESLRKMVQELHKMNRKHTKVGGVRMYPCVVD